MTLRNLSLFWAAVGAIAPIALPAEAVSLDFGETAVDEIYYLSKNLAGRSVGTDKEAETVDYLTGRLGELGYQPKLQSFSYDFRDESLTSYNIVAERTGRLNQQVIVGAHYDNAPSRPTLDRSNLQGTNDNASGAGVLLELAERLQPDPELTYQFVLFGAEEIGLVGSDYYADSLGRSGVKKTEFMVNLDSLIVGDRMYFNAGRGATENPGWFEYRDLALEIAAELDIEAYTNPGLNPNYPAGTGCCSDLESFDQLMPVLAAEATNWSIGELDGYTQTANPAVPGGATWHDPATDNLTFINRVFPGLIEERASNYVAVFDTLLSWVDDRYESVPEPTGMAGMLLAAGLGGWVSKRRRA
ncbi:M28 family peptidase [Romeria aff. gracilis LEGE 07310]|uniref:M28 family peptidase n=1 Tax=Vasconcelosia minhoensis LEGE 07310 TaxID=915328 RepID=A0A8J7AWR6_9CYAN|nr:M28 family peptidase [Romeria gracilis]MBE9080319.1 M28 family peptidase [Romeria aff. gracilis LEGE 07310]